MVSTIDGAGIEWATARVVAHGHVESGDECCVRTLEHRTLVAVLDGLGHGPEAASAARIGVRQLEQSNAHDVVTLVRQCHIALRGSRGAVMSLAMFDHADGTMTWLGVGNVRGTVWYPQSTTSKALLLRSGVVGECLPHLKPSVVALSEGNTLVIATDGIAPEIDDRLLRSDSLQAIAERIVLRCRMGHDDALVLLARSRGAGR